MEIHIVTRGETVFSIALRYGVSAERIIRDNGLQPPYALPVGLALLILLPREVYTIKAGDTLQSIAEQNGISINQLLRNNPPLTREMPLDVGEELVLSYNQQKQGSFFVSAYAYPYITDRLMMEVLPYLSAVIPFTYGFDSGGGLIPLNDVRLLQLAEQYGIPPVMHLSTLNSRGEFDSTAAVNILTQTAERQILITNIINVMGQKGYTGLDVDFEFIPPQYTYEYYDFLRVLKIALEDNGYTLTVALAPKVSADQRGLLYEAHDYGFIGSVADYVFLMTYEWGYTYSPPMAVAPVESVRRVLDYAVTEIPREKIIMGIPIYGYDWTLPHQPGTAAQSLSPQAAVSLAAERGSEIRYDEASQSPFFYYTAMGQEHVVWFEDVRSIREKLRLAEEYGFAGVGYWHAGRRFAGNWSLLNVLYNIEG